MMHDAVLTVLKNKNLPLLFQDLFFFVFNK